MATAVNGSGVAITFSGITYPLLSVDGPSMSRPMIDATNMGTTANWKEFIPGKFVDPGKISAKAEYDGNAPSFSTAATAITITYPNGQTITGNGYLESFNASVPFEDKMTCDFTIQLTGAVVSS